jgi:hypothetical protein
MSFLRFRLRESHSCLLAVEVLGEKRLFILEIFSRGFLAAFLETLLSSSRLWSG